MLTAHAQSVHRIDRRVHVARCVEQGDDLNALGIGILDDGIHVALAQLAGGAGRKVRVALLNGTGDSCAAVVLAVDRQGHIVQQEAQAVVAEGQLQVREVIFCQLIDDALDLTDGEILSAAVQVENAQELAVLGRGLVLARLGAGRGGECGDGQQPDHQNHRQNQRQQSLPRRSCLRLVHFVHSFPLYVIFSPARFQAL